MRTHVATPATGASKPAVAPATRYIRSAVLTDYANLARSVGLDPLALLARVGLNPASLYERDLLLPVDVVDQLLDLSARESGEEAFGLRLAQTRRLSNLGPIGLVARESPTVRGALTTLGRHVRLHNQALAIAIDEHDGIATLREQILFAGGASRQATELVVGTLHGILKFFVGETWQARRVCFTHAAPLDTRLHRRLFGPAVEFGADFNGIITTSRALDTALPSADPVMAAYARHLVANVATRSDVPFADEVRQLILLRLASGRATVDEVAQQLATTRRTMHRRLAAEGTHFKQLLTEIRRELAPQYLANPRRPLSDTATMLGFSGLAVFSRWHRLQYGAAASSARSVSRDQTPSGGAL